MQVSVESSGELGRKLKVEIPAEQVDDEVMSRLKDLRGKVRLDGFRPGKIPLKVVRARFGKDVRREVVGEVMQRSFQEAVLEQALNPAGTPEIDLELPAEGQALEYTASFEVYPDIKLADLSGLKLEKPKVEINDQDIDKMLQTLREQRPVWQDVDGAAKTGQRVVINIVGKIDGEAFEGGTADGLEVEIGSNSMIPGFEDQLEGIKAGEDRVVTVKFPEDYAQESLQGKEASFDTHCTAVQESTLPELDEEFAKALGVEEGGIDTLRDEVREQLESQASNNVRARLRSQCSDQLVDLHEVSLPEALVKQEIELERQQMQRRLQGADSGELADSLFEENARRRVTLGLILGQIIKEQDIELDRDRVDQHITDMAAGYGDPQMFLEYYRQDPQRMAGVESTVLEEQVFDYLAGEAEITEVEQSFDELMNPPKNSEEEAKHE